MNKDISRISARQTANCCADKVGSILHDRLIDCKITHLVE